MRHPRGRGLLMRTLSEIAANDIILKEPRRSMSLWYRFSWYCLYPLARLIFRFSVHGLENVPHEGPVLIASNHCSHLDPPLVALGINRQITFLAKEELFSVPILGMLIRTFGAYPVSRGQGRCPGYPCSVADDERKQSLANFSRRHPQCGWTDSESGARDSMDFLEKRRSGSSCSSDRNA